jgi:hypothetical protein
LGLLLQGQKLEEWAATLWPVIAIGALLYVLIPALEGFLVAWQSEDASTGARAGRLVGGIGFLVLVVSFTFGAILTSPQCQSGPGVVCNSGTGGWLIGAAVVIIGILFLVEGIGSMIGGQLGGSIGGLVGQRLARKSHPDRARVVQESSPGEMPG